MIISNHYNLVFYQFPWLWNTFPSIYWKLNSRILYCIFSYKNIENNTQYKNVLRKMFSFLLYRLWNCLLFFRNTFKVMYNIKNKFPSSLFCLITWFWYIPWEWTLECLLLMMVAYGRCGGSSTRSFLVYMAKTLCASHLDNFSITLQN